MDTQFRSPTGVPIVGILEAVDGTAWVSGWTKAWDGFGNPKFEPAYEGETTMDWDSQKPKLHHGRMQVVDDEGTIWYLDECLPSDVLDTGRTDQSVSSDV